MEDEEFLKKMSLLPRFLMYDVDGRGIEVKPGRFSPVYINMKAVWSYPTIFKVLLEKIEPFFKGCNHIIGIESGGSPYAAISTKSKSNKYGSI